MKYELISSLSEKNGHNYGFTGGLEDQSDRAPGGRDGSSFDAYFRMIPTAGR